MMKDRILLLVLVLLTATAPVVAQQQEQATIQLTIEPTELALALGEKTTLTATVRDGDGNIVDRPVLFFSQARRAVSVNASTGEVEALRPGDYMLTARVPSESAEGASIPSVVVLRSQRRCKFRSASPSQPLIQSTSSACQQTITTLR